jgi:hypothetical protein
LRAELQELRVGLCRAIMNAHRRVRTIDGGIDPIAIGALARLDKIDWGQAALVGVPVTVSDGQGKEVARAVISFAVTARND